MIAYCQTCGKECEPELIDVGIGPYEFWGARYVDSRLQVVSPCCEGDCYKEMEVIDETPVFTGLIENI